MRDRLEASYVWPSIGHYTGHFSGCLEGLGHRPSTWHNPYVQEAVRLIGQRQQHRSPRAFASGTLYSEVQLPPQPPEYLRWFTSLGTHSSEA